MIKEYSPFTPGVPVPLEFFVGRTKEIQRIISSIKKSIEINTVERLFVMGERGIGKSSICNFARSVAEKDLDILGLHVFLGGVDNLEEMVRRIFEKLLRESTNKPWYGKIKRFLGNHIKQLDIFGLTVEFSATKHELTKAVNDFIPALKNLLQQLAPGKRGILLILDDFNGLALSEHFANWLKSFVDEIATSLEPIPLTIVLVGLPERRKQLIDTQPSLDRVFDLVEIKRFNERETREFFERYYGKVNVSIDEKALDLLWRFSGGYPVFMHELGDAVFKVDADNNIDHEDTFAGIFRGAKIIGDKYIEPKVLDSVRSEKYQHILHKISQKPLEHRFLRRDVVSKLSAEEAKVFDNFLRRMEDLGVIRKDRERGPGSYEFTSELYYLFFWLHASAPITRQTKNGCVLDF